MTRKIALLDGHSLAYRAFYALPDTLATTSGQVTNAVYGFTSMVIKLLGDEKPHGLAVCFDAGRPASRMEAFPEYKANRAATPDLFKEQLPLIRDVLNTLNIPVLEVEGWEADDLLATLARKIQDAGDQPLIVSGDRDVLQLVSDEITVLMTGRGVTDTKRYTPSAVHERYGVTPEQWCDFAALKGETSDNLPGIPGVGDKTAAKLLNKYGDLEGVLAAAGEQTPKLSQNLAEHADQARINRKINELIFDAPVELPEDGFAVTEFDDDRVREHFASLEFMSLYPRLRDLQPGAGAAEPTVDLDAEPRPLNDPDQLTQLNSPVKVALSGDFLAFAETDSAPLTLPLDEVERVRGWLEDPNKHKAGHDLKPLIRELLRRGIELRGVVADTAISTYLLDPGAPGGYSLGIVAERYLGLQLGKGKEKKKADALFDLDPDLGEDAALEAAVVSHLEPVLSERLAKIDMAGLATEMELPLMSVLAEMEHNGILIDTAYLTGLDTELAQKIAELEKLIIGHAGEEFNVNSNLQLQQILFDKLELPRTKRIKTGYSTDQAELQKLEGSHPIISDLLAYREVSKLRSGFTESLLGLIEPDGRIRTTYVQTAAATGRLSSTAPNLQNIPIRSDAGRQIRKAFIAPPGHVLLAADYSQIELRVLAHLSSDPGILEAFTSGHDFHSAIAAKVYGIDVTDVSVSQRSFAKQFAYGIAYGMSAYGVSQRLDIEIDEASEFVDAYYAQFPKVKDFLDEQVAKAKVDGYTTTMFGRRRYLPELQARNPRIRAMGERMALNAPIQGTAADIIKRAMLNTAEALRKKPDIARMLLTVHDELVFEVPEDRIEEARELVREAMESAADLQCRLVVDAHHGPDWDAAHA